MVGYIICGGVMTLFGEPTEIEKQDLEVHVEMAAMRKQQCQIHFGAIATQIEELHKHIEEKFNELDIQIDIRKNNFEKEIERVDHNIALIKTEFDALKEDHNKQVISWGTAIIAMLLSSIGILLVQFIFPLLTGKILAH